MSLRLLADTIRGQHARTHGTGKHHTPRYYESKFADFIEMCESLENDMVMIVAAPEVLVDTYGEIVESLARLAPERGYRSSSQEDPDTRRTDDFKVRRRNDHK